MEKRTVRIIDTTIRDGIQTLWSWRVASKKILPIAFTMDKAGFEAIDYTAALHLEICIKHFQENPWEQIRAMRRVIKKTPIIAQSRCMSGAGFGIVPEEVVELLMERFAANGVRRVMLLDALFNVGNLQICIKAARKAGLEISIPVIYTISPVHTDEYYMNKISQLAALDVDSICLRDPSGILTPDRARTLIPVVRQAVGSKPLQLKCHCLTGLATQCYIEAIKHGVDALFTASSPLANGPSVPSHEDIIQAAGELGYTIEIDERRLADMSEYFTDLAKEEGKQLARPVTEFDPAIYEHQVPGGMMSFLIDQLREMGQEHRLAEVLKEVPRVRKELGYPVMVTPLSQLVGAQAFLNVIMGERYKVVPDEVKKYVLGYFGKPEMPIDPNIRDRIEDEAKGALDLSRENGSAFLESIRKKYGPFKSDDDLLLYALFPEHLVKEVL